MSLRIFYAAGPGGVIKAHEHWKQTEDCQTEVSVTFSGQFEQFCQHVGAAAYIVSYHSERAVLHDGAVILEQRPKPMPGARGLRYHLAEFLYGLSLLATAVRFRADLAIIDSGTTHYFVTALFRLMGIRVVPALYNTIWPCGFPPARPIHRLICWLDSLFYRYVATAVIGVSPECIRQVQLLTPGRHPPLYLFLPQFRPEHFERIPPPPPHDQRPFRIVFVGRATRVKGVFDVLEMAQKVEARVPGQIRWEMCGSGPDLAALKHRQHEMGLESIVNIRGWTSPSDQIGVYARSHAAVVPTRSSFNEGLAMTVVEAVLAGRPVITNLVVPALEVLRPACVEARTDDVESYVEGVLKLLDNREYYDALRRPCPELGRPFFDRQQGLTAVLERVIEALGDRRSP